MHDPAASPNDSDSLLAALRSARQNTGAVAVAVWTVADSGFRLEAELGLADLGLTTDPALQASHQEALGHVLQSAGEGHNAIKILQSSEYQYCFLASPSREPPRAIAELVLATSASSNQPHIEPTLATLCHAAHDFLIAQQQCSWQRTQSLWCEFQSILPLLHRGLRMGEVAYHIANEGRKFVGCDRLSVANCAGSRPQLLSVSGVASIERRAKQVRDLESLVAAVVPTRRPLRYPQDVNLAPQIDRALQTYLDSSQCQRLWIIPVMREADTAQPVTAPSAECCAALIFECFTDRDPPECGLRTQWLVQHAEFGLRHALQFESLPLLGLSLQLQTVLGGYRGRRLWVTLGISGCAILLLLSLLLPADLEISASGTLQPQQLRHIYAPANGEIVELHAHHRQPVRSGQSLIVIRSRESELKKEELLTQRGVTQEKLRSIEAARLKERRIVPNDLGSAIDLSASERELRETLASQDQQLALLNEIVNSLTLTSPIDGTVISWNPSESLENRPVQQGQKLMSVAQREAAGMLELRVLDEDIRYVQQAQARHAAALPVTFVIASDPGQVHVGRVDQIGTIAETLSGVGASIRVAVVVAAEEMNNATPGATVNAKIHCGRAAIGYVWTRRLWDFLRMQLI